MSTRIGRALLALFGPPPRSVADKLLDRAASVGEADARLSLQVSFRRADFALSRHYEDDERALWWHRPHPQLGGVSAIEALLAGRGDEVEQVVERLDSGAYL